MLYFVCSSLQTAITSLNTHYPADLCNDEVWCSLSGSDSILKYLDEFRDFLRMRRATPLLVIWLVAWFGFKGSSKPKVRHRIHNTPPVVCAKPLWVRAGSVQTLFVLSL
jgi:hypothetical protein